MYIYTLFFIGPSTQKKIESTIGRLGELDISNPYMKPYSHKEEADRLLKKYGPSAIVIAAQYGNNTVAHLLLEKGVDVNHANEVGSTALHNASYAGTLESVRMLLDAGADVHHANTYGETAIQLASIHGYTEIVLLLLQRGANINSSDVYGQTALHRAVRMGYETTALVLINAGATITPHIMTEIKARPKEFHAEVQRVLAFASASASASA